MKALVGQDAWQAKYRSLSEPERRQTWILLFPESGPTMYVQNFKDWPDVLIDLKKKNIRLKKIGLQYRSHTAEFDVDKSDGVYIAQTAKGSTSGITIHCFSLGYAKDGMVYRTLYTTPDLTPDLQLEDKIEEVIQEALLIYDQEKNREK
jgi:hypothetical protein